MQEAITYPFSAIVSLADLKLALILNAINPKIGGLLIRGPKGSGKTTAVRALADILPKIKVVKGCSFNCNPEDPSNMCEKCRNPYMKDGKLPFEERKMRVIDLPLGATEDRVVGSLDVEKVIKMGIEALELGILAQANQNILYVDEVNLLPDHIADDLLDAAATGWNVVEREGISIKHPSRFIFIGTMNPEEGHLRPQLLDRFPLCVEVKRISDVKDRIEIVKRNMEFEVDPERFVEKYGVHLEKLKSKIIQAKKILSEVEVSEKLVAVICEACLELKVDGMRPDIVIAKTAKTLAAFENKAAVALEHILKSAELALNHRTREGGFLEPATPDEIKKTFMDKVKEVGYEEKDKSRSKPKIETKKGIRKKRRVFFWPKKISEKREVSPDRRLKKPVKRFKKAIFTLDKLLRGAISSFKKHEAPKEARALNGVSSAKPRQLTEGVPLFTKIKA
ncbi:MAG: AAA family ATPase, partial [Candidatus Bathyarchaeota archaeon]|nr:AAA family ATPase [Candidatus Bathyarchaeota archaeon]